MVISSGCYKDPYMAAWIESSEPGLQFFGRVLVRHESEPKPHVRSVQLQVTAEDLRAALTIMFPCHSPNMSHGQTPYVK